MDAAAIGARADFAGRRGPSAQPRLADCTPADAHFPENHTLLAAEDATIGAVLDALPEHSYAHFARHGGIDLVDLTASGVYLTDGVLTIQALSRRSTPPGAALALQDTASALHDATQQLRHDGHPPALWAPYIHTGP